MGFSTSGFSSTSGLTLTTGLSSGNGLLGGMFSSSPSLVVTTPPSFDLNLLKVGATLSTCQVAGSYVWPGGTVTETWTWLVDGVAQAGSYVIVAGDALIEADVALSAAGYAGSSIHIGPVNVTNSAPSAGDVTLTGTVAAGTAMAPAAMAAPTVTTTATRITITKAADPSNGGSPITDYDYRTSTDGGSTWSAWSALASPQTVAGFTPGSTTVRAQTRANNAVGKGATGTAASATMKVVTFVGYANASGTGSTMTIDLTTLQTDTGGIGGAIQQDDVIFVGSGWATSSTNVDVSLSSTGWTEIDDLFNGSTRAVNLGVYWKTMGATPDTSIVAFASNAAGNGSAALALVYRYVDPSNPFDVTYVPGTHSATGTGSALADSPPITPVSPGAYISSLIAATGDTTPAAMNAPTGMTLSGRSGTGGTARGYRLGAARKTDWVSGAFDPAAWSSSESAASDSWAAVVYALKPY